MSFIVLRVLALLALLVLIWNPAGSRVLPSGDEPIVLVDASLSMSGAPWRAALDSARALARRRAVVWRFGTRVSLFDTTPPADGSSRLAPALEAAAGRAGEVIVLTDGALNDVGNIPPDLLRRPHVILTPRPLFWDAYVAGVEGPRHVTRGDTVRLKVSYGTAGKRETGSGKRAAQLVIRVGSHRLIEQRVVLPDSGTVSSELTIPVSRFPFPGWQVLQIALDGVGDAEPRDDTRLFAIEVSSEPAAVILASPPDWESRFFAKTLSDVARVPVKLYVETERGRWRDAASLAPVPTTDVSRASAAARLVVTIGDPARTQSLTASVRASRLAWVTNGQAGDWYVEPPLSSPLTGTLSGLLWDSLPPATAVAIPSMRDTSGALVALSARLVRRGQARPIVMLAQRSGTREATIGAAGLWRWAFRGGAAEQAYRTLVAGLVDWLLGEQSSGTRERVVPDAFEVPNGLPVMWNWISRDPPQPVVVTLEMPPPTVARRVDTLRFDAAGRAELHLPPGTYRYALAGGSERGVVAVEQYSEEWLPRAPTIGAQSGEVTARLASVGLRDRWWLFVIAIAALATEWALRRRQGLP
jgi:hypothetical protein